MRVDLSRRALLTLSVASSLGLLYFAVVRASVGRAQPTTASDALSQKYLQPADLTKIDWLLLKAEVESVGKVQRWDDYNLIESVALYRPHITRGLVGMTFVVNNDRYVGIPDAMAKKVFSNAVLNACDILATTIPEVEKGANVYANFVLNSGPNGGPIIAEYYNEGVHLRN